MAEVSEDVSAARTRILDGLVRGLVLAGFVALVPSLAACFRADLLGVAVADVSVYGGVLALHFLRERWSYRRRVYVLLFLASTLSLVLLYTLGLEAAGLLWLMATPILGSILLDVRAAWIVWTGLATVLAAFGAWVSMATLPFEQGEVELLPLRWWVMVTNAMLIAAALMATVQVILRVLESANLRLTSEKRARVELEADLRSAQQTAAVGALAGGVAHELNNLLQAIMVPVALVQERLSDEALRKDLTQALVASQGARDVTRRLLDLARRGAPTERECVLLDARVEEALTLVRVVLPVRTAVLFARGAHERYVQMARGELEVLLVNLCMNAAQACPDSPIRVSTMPAEGGAVLRISDDGPGIPPDLQPRVFDAFFTTRPEGTGLGLATVHRIVESMGGRIDLDSSSAGTTFQLFLPQAEPEGVDAARERRVLARSLLLVDDDEGVRMAHRTAFEREGYAVATAASAEEGLAFLDGSVDVMITDLRMPGMGGTELVRRALALYPTLRIVVCSGMVDGNLERSLYALGVFRILHKPVMLRELLGTVRQAGAHSGGKAPHVELREPPHVYA